MYKFFIKLLLLNSLICATTVLKAQILPNNYSIEIIGDSIIGGISIANVVGDGISIIDTSGNMQDGIQIVAPGDDGIFVFSPNDDGNHVVSAGGDGFYSQLSGDDGFQSVDAGGDGIFIANSNGFSGYFGGDVEVTGSLAKAAGSFKIDHPLDPENKILYHSFVESPDMMNIYNGNVILDENGSATVTLPDWFSALNKEFRYQLTCVGGFAQVFISKKVENNQFSISGGIEGLEISWMITGIRNDPYAQKFRIPTEVEKTNEAKGTYLQPEAYNQPYEKSETYRKLLEDQENLQTKFK